MESISPNENTDPLVLRRVKLSELTDSEGFSLALPDGKVPATLGLFLCKDSAGLGRCFGKTNANSQQLAREYWGDVLLQHRPRNAATPEDKIYYFSFLLVDHEGLTLVRPDASKADYRLLNTALSQVSADPAEARKIVAKVWNANLTLTSSPAVTGGDLLALVLPRYDERACPPELRTKTRKVESRTSKRGA